MTLPIGQPVAQNVGRSGKVDEKQPSGTCMAPQSIAISPAQRRTAKDQTLGMPGKMLAASVQPRPAVMVGQRNARAHLGDCRRIVERVSVLKRHSGSTGQFGPERGLAAARDTHQHDMRYQKPAHGIPERLCHAFGRANRGKACRRPAPEKT